MTHIPLTDLANLAQVASIPIAILTWLVSKEKFANFWRRWFFLILISAFILGFIGLWNLGWLSWLQIAVPLWAVLLSLLGLFVAITLVSRKSKPINNSQKVEEPYLVQIGSLKWNATFSFDNKLIRLEQVPYCVQHEMRLVEHFPLYFCPLFEECNSSISRMNLPVAYQEAISIIESQIRKASK